MKVGYLTSFQKPTGAGVGPKIVMDGLASDVDVTAINIQQTGYPEPLIHDEGEYPWIFPHDLAEVLREQQFDVLIVHTYNTELFGVLEDLRPDLDTAMIYRHGTNMFENWVGRAAGRPLQLSSLSSIVWDLDMFDAISCPSQTVADRIQLYYGDDAPALMIIPNPIDLHNYTPTTYFDGDALKVVIAGRLQVNNYMPMPLLAVRRLIEDYDVTCRVIGGGNEALANSLQRLAGDAEEIEFLGHVSREQVIRNLERADVACVPAISHNAVPYAVIEALAAGCVTLASESMVMREEPAVIPMPHESPSEWYEALSDACTDIEDCKEIVRDGLEAARKYRVEDVVEQGYLPLFERLSDGGLDVSDE